ncbi:MAG: helix-turn-helix transcriptional regulator, partial [Deltaproteobacteria bacterium]|nr:helix-turn-helix transcriptional regulator [Deltaproteobacteria bacterium]
AKMSFTYLSNVENGNADPSLSTLRRIAKALKVKVADLLGEIENESLSETQRKEC